MERYGTLPDGRAVHRVTLTNRHGLLVRLINYGARLTELQVPDRHGSLADIVLGHDRLEQYVANTTYFGATCGRYANRIAEGRFTLDGQTVQLDINEGANHLHGGRDGFDRKLWDIAAHDSASVTFTAHSADGEMGYPGACDLTTTYALTDANRLTITMQATTTRPTVINMVNHAYFNLAGQGSGDVLAQTIQLNARSYTPVDAELLATGDIRGIAGTAFDFRLPKPIGQDFAKLGETGRGYDHNWCLSYADTVLRPCAIATDPASGRRMTLATTEPGVQFYTGGFLDETMTGKLGKPLCRYAGFTLETQKFPGSPHWPQFPSSRLDPGQTYHHAMAFGFDTVPA